jgi:hypothetical protein
LIRPFVRSGCQQIGAIMRETAHNRNTEKTDQAVLPQDEPRNALSFIVRPLRRRERLVGPDHAQVAILNGSNVGSRHCLAMQVLQIVCHINVQAI